MSGTVTVCSACLQASCWQGVFYCEDYKTAGTVEKTREQLEGMNLEDPSYWETPALAEAVGRIIRRPPR